MTVAEHTQLTDLLVAKDKEMKETIALAKSQAKIVKKMEALKAEVERQDVEIQSLQRQFKEAEQVLSTAIFQAQQKLASINRANRRPVMSEELIKFAHRISASNAVCAPLTWQQGDPRRPYPTDIEMRLGFLGRSDLPLNGHMVPPQALGDLARPGHAATGGEIFDFFKIRVKISEFIRGTGQQNRLFPSHLSTNTKIENKLRVRTVFKLSFRGLNKIGMSPCLRWLEVIPILRIQFFIQ